MHKLTRLIALTLAIMNGAVAAHAAPTAQPSTAQIPSGPTQCAFNGWTSFDLDASCPVRAAPSHMAKVIGTIPVDSDADKYPSNIEFDIVEARPGWLKIDNAQDPVETDGDGTPVPSRPVYQGAGWIPDHAVQIGIQSARGHARPDAASPLILDLGDDWLSDFATINAIRGCSGEWLLIDYAVHARREKTGALTELAPSERVKGTAWFRGICSNQHTTCDMASVDQRP